MERTLLDYRGHPKWRDMSEYAVHFTKDLKEGSDGYWPMMSILSQGRLNPSGPFGIAADLDLLGESQKSVCLSEIPLDMLARIVAERSEFGIGFNQSFLVTNGGARVWYVNEPSSLAESWNAVVSNHNAKQDPDAEIWRMTPFVDFASEFAPFSHYEWEREWRVPGGLEFTPTDVAFLFVPEEHHRAARSFFEEVKRGRSGPSYACPLLDPAWPEARLQQAFAKVVD